MLSRQSSVTYDSRSRPTTSCSAVSSTTYRKEASHPSTNIRPRTRAKTATSTGVTGDQQLVCAVAESRGVLPTIGLAFVNLSTTNAVLCQIVDNQTYVQTLHKLHVFQPTEILVPDSFLSPTQSKLLQVLQANLDLEASITTIGRKFWNEASGLDYIHALAFEEDVEAIKMSVGGNYFATSCFSAALGYIEDSLGISFAAHSMRIKYEPSEGSMRMDISTIRSLELIQNLRDAKSKDCLFGVLNSTMTPMGSRLIRGTILQPLTEKATIQKRYEALEDLISQENIFFAIRQALKAFLDVDRVLTEMVVMHSKPSIHHLEQSINNVILVKQYVKSVPAVYEAMDGVKSELLLGIRQLCSPEMYSGIVNIIDHAINPDITYQKKPIDLRNQRTYAIKSGVNGLIDIARQTYKEVTEDAYDMLREMTESQKLNLDLKFDDGRQYYFTLPVSDLEYRDLPAMFINAYRKKNVIECQTMDLIKLNQKIMDSHHEVLLMSDKTVQDLIVSIRNNIAPLFKISESIAMLDMLASFAQAATTQDYCRPELTSTLAVKGGRHPIRERIHTEKYVPNDVYATEQSRLQIITGCNMSGKSTYIRSIALMIIMAQIGSFVPADYASLPVRHQLFTRVSLDDSSTSNVSTFSAEMRETAFILRSIDASSLVIIDELGRGTSTRDGLAIAVAVAEALIRAGAFVWFVTHFRELPQILAERPGVVNLHLAVGTDVPDCMTMMYKVAQGPVQEMHYGLALAKVAGLPPDVITVAEKVSSRLMQLRDKKRTISWEVFQARRKKLMLGLKEQLWQAKEGNMKGEALCGWLKSLQDEFVRRMSGVDDAEREAAENTITTSTDSEDRSSVTASGTESAKASSPPTDIQEDDAMTAKEIGSSMSHVSFFASSSTPAASSLQEHFSPFSSAQFADGDYDTTGPTSSDITMDGFVRTPSPNPERLAKDARYVMCGALAE